MESKHFLSGIFIRVVGLLITNLLGAVVLIPGNTPLGLSRWLGILILLILLSYQIYDLNRYVTGLNRKLTRFLESVRHSDFAITFKVDNSLGQSFTDLNQQFNEVLEAFRQARAEKEANLHYLNTIVQHVNVGLLTFNSQGNVEMINQAALRLLNTYRLQNLNELQSTHPGLFELLKITKTGTPTVYQTRMEQELSIRCSIVNLRGRSVTVASFQNIHSELQQKELEAWQNLTKVLRHEIMNSITPIVSLVGTMQQIVHTELIGASTESVDDLREALTTIEQRSQGIMCFVDAYRNFTAIPQPRLAEVSVAALLRNVIYLVQPDLQQQQITLQVPSPPKSLIIFADSGQIEMVLINLIKNAMESLSGRMEATIQLNTDILDNRPVINVIDNGIGIEPEALERIFIPFYTTKKTGSGIGLSLSRQIMQLHNGQLKVASTPQRGSTFSLIFSR